MQTRFLNIEYIFNLIYSLFVDADFSLRSINNFFRSLSFYQDLVQAWSVFSVIATLMSLLFGAIIVYALFRIRQIRLAEAQIYGTDAAISPEDFEKDPEKNSQWEKVVALSRSESENDWRQAILLADSMLDSMLTSIGYDGESVAEKLKQVEPADFQTLQYAWEAHKVRNRIAHDAGEFVLTHKDVREVISWFQVVFEEFFYI